MRLARSGASGSGHSNSDSSFSMRRSSFDCSSSVRSFVKKVITSKYDVKLVITEKELKDWNLSFRRDDDEPEMLRSKSRNTESIDSSKKSVRWNKVCNVCGFKHKNRDTMCETLGGNTISPFNDVTSERQRNLDQQRFARSISVVGSRNLEDDMGSSYRRKSVDNAGLFAFNRREDFKLERNTSAKYSTVDLEDDVVGDTPFYMTPLRSLRNRKSEKFKLGNLLRLN